MLKVLAKMGFTIIPPYQAPTHHTSAADPIYEVVVERRGFRPSFARKQTG